MCLLQHLRALPVFLALQHSQLPETYSSVLQIVAPPAGSNPTVSDAVIDLLSFPTADAANTSQGQLSDAVQQGRFDQASLHQWASVAPPQLQHFAGQLLTALPLCSTFTGVAGDTKAAAQHCLASTVLLQAQHGQPESRVPDLTCLWVTLQALKAAASADMTNGTGDLLTSLQSTMPAVVADAPLSTPSKAVTVGAASQT